MKNRNLFFIAMGAALTLASCVNESSKKTEESATEQEKTCVYTYTPESTKLSWTAYKFSEKVGVKGGFDSIYVDGIVPSGSIAQIFEKASFSVPVSTINTANPERDEKIKKYFFGSLKETQHLTGKVVSVQGDDQTGVITCSLNMNKQLNHVDLSYYMSGDTLIAKGRMDATLWGAASAVAALNKACLLLHKGPGEGGSVLWPDFELEIRTVLSKDCK